MHFVCSLLASTRGLHAALLISLFASLLCCSTCLLPRSMSSPPSSLQTSVPLHN